MKHTKYLTYILYCFQEIKLEGHIFEDKNNKGKKYQSGFNYVKNCTIQYSNLKPDATRQYPINQE